MKNEIKKAYIICKPIFLEKYILIVNKIVTDLDNKLNVIYYTDGKQLIEKRKGEETPENAQVVLGHYPYNSEDTIEEIPLTEDLICDSQLNDYLEIKYADEKFGLVGVDEDEEIYVDDDVYEACMQDFLAGYNKAKEVYKFSESDILRCWKPNISAQELIKSLNKLKMPIFYNLEEIIYAEDRLYCIGNWVFA